MKYSRTFLLAFFLFVVPFQWANAQCELDITDLVIEAYPCDSDGNFLVDIDFNYSGGTDSFTVIGNGNQYGTFAYSDLFITLGPFDGNGSSVYEFYFSDTQTFCSTIGFVGPVNCGSTACDISNLTVDNVFCNSNGSFNFVLDFDFVGVNNDFFDVYADGNIIGTYPFSSIPMSIQNFPSNGNTNEILTICVNDTPNCCETLEFTSPNCTINNCEIWDLVAEAHDCDADGNFLVDIDFNSANTSDSFDIYINGDGPDDYYGTYSYSNLFETIGPFEGNGQYLEFFIVDQNEASCYMVTTILSPQCNSSDCELWDLVAEAHDCDADGNFLVDIDFNYANTSDSFNLLGNGVNFGTFSYTDLFITLGPLEGNGNLWEFIIIDQNISGCEEALIFESPNCDPDCEVNDLSVDLVGCNPDGTYELILNFNTQNPTNNFFDVFANGAFFGFYSLNDLPITIEDFPASGNALDIIQVCINDNSDCCETLEFEAPNCGGDCIEFNDLTSGTFYGTPQYEDDDLIFTIGGVPVKIKDFEYAGGTQFNGAIVMDNTQPQFMYPNFDGNFMAPASANLEFNFLQLAGVVISLEFDFYSNGGEINIGANDAPLVEATSFFDLDGMEIAPGVTITVTQDPGNPLLGHATIDGFVGFLTLGASDALFFDNICYELATFGNVWPGDCDTDNISSNFDLLNIGVAYGATGDARIDPTIGWLPQPADDWAQNFLNDVNFKHADTNGDGVVNESDKFAIDQNFGLSHGILTPYTTPLPNPSAPSFFVIMPSAADIEVGAFEAEIHLGSSSSLVDDIYGLAFTFEFNDQVFDGSSMQIIFEDGWLNNNGSDDLLTMQHQEDGNIYTAVTRINQSNISGGGKIGKITGIIDDLSGYAEIEFKLIQIKAIKANEDVLAFQTPENFVELEPNSLNNPKESKIQIFPNPANDVIFVKNDYELPIERIRLINVLGQEVLVKGNETNDLEEITVADFPQGIYFMEIHFNGFSVSKKIKITR